jgi:hypothetical protein
MYATIFKHFIMERNTATTIDKLLTGDRFYKAGDKNKEVYTVWDGKTKRTKWQTYKYHALKDGEKYPVAIKATTQIIFLRHANVEA